MLLPDSWELKTLGEVSEPPQYGWTTKASSEGRVRLLRTTDITSGAINWETVPYCTDIPSDVAKYLLKDGDIVISRAGSVGFSYLVKNPESSVFASYLIRFRPLINEKYFAYFLQSPNYWQAISENSLGIAIPNVNASKLKTIQIPIAPENEQERIVERIESLFSQLDAGVAALKRAQAKLKRYKAAVLKAACEGRLVPQDPNDEAAEEMLKRISGGKQRESRPLPEDLPELPQGWCWVRMEHLGTHRLGKMLDKEKNIGTPRPYLRNANVRWFNFDLSDLFEIKVTDEEFINVCIQPGDLVVCEGGEPGRSAVWEKEEPIVFQKALHRLRPHKGISAKYINLHLAADASRGRLEDYFTGSTIKHFTGEAFRSCFVAIPPALEQARIVDEMDRQFSIIHEMENAISANLTRAARLRQSILKLAFEGRLVEQAGVVEEAGEVEEEISQVEAPARWSQGWLGG